MSSNTLTTTKRPLDLVALGRNLAGLSLATVLIAIALSSLGPNFLRYVMAQDFMPHAPDTSALKRLPIAILFHMVGALTSVVLGAVVLYARKGTANHKLMGRVWVLAMAVTALSSFFMKSFAPMLGQFGPIHILSVWVVISLPRAIWMARIGNIQAHLRIMKGMYWGLLFAGVLTFIPGRTLFDMFFG